MNRSYYSDTITNFRITFIEKIVGVMALASEYPDEPNQKDAWVEEIRILKEVLFKYDGSIYFEYIIPRMGKRIDVVLIIRNIIFVLEFKVGESQFPGYAVDQVWDYTLDLKNFHETSHDKYIMPVLIATQAHHVYTSLSNSKRDENLFEPVKCNTQLLNNVINDALEFVDGELIDIASWEKGRYSPTPTIIEAA